MYYIYIYINKLILPSTLFLVQVIIVTITIVVTNTLSAIIIRSVIKDLRVLKISFVIFIFTIFSKFTQCFNQ